MSKRLLVQLRQWAGEALLCALVLAFLALDFLRPLSLSVVDFWYKVFSRPATGDIIVLQIDARSLNELDTWPWPRSRHAKVVDALHQAGAATIAFDVDFSSLTDAEDDGAFAQAIERAEGTVVLPSFVQPTGLESRTLMETYPLGILMNGALVGNANIYAPEGVVREASLGVMSPTGAFRPSFAALLGERGLTEDGIFTIDYSINVKSIPHMSYVDVLNGKFNPAKVKGKRVVIGATALELGDRVAVPVFGVIAGVDLQAMIAESILQNRMLIDTQLAGEFLMVALVIAFMRPSRCAWKTKDVLFPSLAAVSGAVALSGGVFWLGGAVIDPIAGAVAACASVIWAGLQELAARSRSVIRERTTSSFRRTMIDLIVEESSDGIVVARDNGRIELCNEQAARLLNVTRKTLTGRPAKSFLPSYDSLSSEVENAPRQCDLTLEGVDGEILVELTVRRTAFQEWQGASAQTTASIDVYTMRDVTAVRKAQAAEKRAQDERLLAERAKNNFIANMSHELRTPLNAIIGFSELLSNEVLGQVEQRAYVEHADIVVKSSHNLLAVVNNVIEVARLDSDMVEVTNSEFDFEDVVAPASSLVRTLSVFKRHEIDFSEAPDACALRSDQKLLKQVVYNLLSNAIKFSGEDGKVWIQSWVSEGDFCFSIRDNGCGMAPDVLPRVSQLFGHAESGFLRAHDGLGVGLYLVKRCLEKLGGTLSFESAKGEGTCVTVVLSGAAVPVPSSQKSSDEAAA